MLLTLATRSLQSLISDSGSGSLPVMDLPAFAIEHLQLHGLNVPASMLSGWSLDKIDRLRDRADKAGCPCLVLIEDTPLTFTRGDGQHGDAAADRLRRLATAANRLGCNSIAITCDGPDNDEAFEQTVSQLKRIMPGIERQELNLLIMPGKRLTRTPEQLTDLIKRIGGFRIGSLPNFEHAASLGDAGSVLRKLAPYAGAIHATIQGFDSKGQQKDIDLTECVFAIRSVGFLNTLAIDYIGDKDPIDTVKQARHLLQEAIEAERE